MHTSLFIVCLPTGLPEGGQGLATPSSPVPAPGLVPGSIPQFKKIGIAYLRF